MVADLSGNYIFPEEYLAFEQDHSLKHEYRNGQTSALSGGSDAHVTIMVNLLTLLRNHVRGTGHRVYVAGMKAQIEAANAFYYPDLLVTNDPRDRSFDDFKRYPCLVVEVLSATSEAFDRGDKFADYRCIETLQEYVLISQKRIGVEVFRRSTGETWTLELYADRSELHLQSVDFRCAIAALYEDVPLAEVPALSRSDREII